jgi:hypothetical protein
MSVRRVTADRSEELRIEAFEMALGRFLDEKAGDAADVEWTVRADGGDSWEIQLWLNGDDAGLWKITDSDQERITE